MLSSFCKKIFFIALLGTGSYFLERFCHRQTDGFFISKIRLASPPSSEPCEPSEEEKALIDKITAKPLQYLGRGGQCYAFATEDGCCVVKLLKYNNNYPKIWQSLFPFPFGFEEYRKKKIKEKREKLQGEYESYAIACQELKRETGILYFHLGRGTLQNKKIRIRDKIGVHHTLDADLYQFYIQKKGTPLYAGIETIFSESGSAGVKSTLNEIVDYLAVRSKKRIRDGDDGIWRNFAFYDGHPFQIDIGQFSYEKDLSSGEAREKDLLFFTKDFRNWLRTLDPGLEEHLIERIKDCVKD